MQIPEHRSQALRFTALGVLMIRLPLDITKIAEEGSFSMLLELDLKMGDSAVLSFEANFNLYINTSGEALEFRKG